MAAHRVGGHARTGGGASRHQQRAHGGENAQAGQGTDGAPVGRRVLGGHESHNREATRILPYVAITVFVVGHWWRYRRDQFSWTSRSTQLLDRRVLGWASPMFHYGALAAVGGHVIGLLIPLSWTDAIGIHEHTYRWIAAIAGGIAGAVSLIGFLGLVYRRATSDRVRRSTTRIDIFTYALLTVLILLGCWMTFAHNLATHAPYNYRDSIGVWWRSLFDLQPNVPAVLHAPSVYQLHAIIAWLFWAAFPFTRLVHAWSIPLQYIGRPYILYRRRFQTVR